MTRPAMRALFVQRLRSSARLREQRIEHFADDALSRTRELAETSWVAIDTLIDARKSLSHTSAPVQITVNPSHPTPTVSLSVTTDTNPAYAPAVLHLNAAVGVDPSSTLSTIAFYNNNVLIGTGSAALLDWLAKSSGSYSLTAVATDSSGESTTSAPVTLSLNPSTVTYIHTDFLGSAIVGTSESGGVAWKAHYAPFGERLDSNTTERLGYTGQPFDTESQLAYHGARYYDPTIGRFYGIDSVEVDAGNIYSFNRYSYADNNPLAKVDRSGRYTCGDSDSEDDCAAASDAAQEIQNSASNSSDPVEVATLNKGLNTLGAENDDNGLIIDLTHDPGEHTVTQQNYGIAGNQRIIINTLDNDTPDKVAAALAHELQHVQDVQANGVMRAHVDVMWTELNAARTEAYFWKGINKTSDWQTFVVGQGINWANIQEQAAASTEQACPSFNKCPD